MQLNCKVDEDKRGSKPRYVSGQCRTLSCWVREAAVSWDAIQGTILDHIFRKEPAWTNDCLVCRRGCEGNDIDCRRKIYCDVETEWPLRAIFQQSLCASCVQNLLNEKEETQKEEEEEEEAEEEEEEEEEDKEEKSNVRERENYKSVGWWLIRHILGTWTTYVHTYTNLLFRQIICLKAKDEECERKDKKEMKK